MSKITAVVGDRTFDYTLSTRQYTDISSSQRLNLEVTSYSWSVVGGPKEANVTVWGSADALWQTAEWLRCPIVFYDERLEPVWWGYVHQVEIRVGAIGIGIALDGMANSIEIDYTAQNDGSSETGTKQRTAAATDADSIAQYGTKQMRQTSQSGNSAGAVSERDALLSFRKYPIPTVSPTDAASLSATLSCKGWWETLGWRYYANATGNVENVQGGGQFAPVGDNTAGQNEKIAQSFKPAASWTATKISVRVRRAGQPGDDLRVQLCANNAGIPGTVLATSTVSGAVIPSNVEWVDVAITSTALVAGTTYWIVLSRTGANNSGDYYQSDIHEGLPYADGSFLEYQAASSIWAVRVPDADMAFRVLGVQETTTQLDTLFASTAGQFLSGANITDASGIFTNQYRDGESSALEVANKLLEMGNSAGGRILARVEIDRTVTLYNEPTSDDTPYRLMSDGKLVDTYGQRILNHTCPVGFWAALGDVIPPTAQFSYLANPSPIFIEESSYNPASDSLSLSPRAMQSPYSVGKVDEG